MKKHALLFFALFLLGTQKINSQSRIGLHMGLGKVASDYQGELDLSFNIGVTAEFPISEFMCIQSGLSWNNRAVNTAVFSESDNFALDNVQIPIAFKLKKDFESAEIYCKLGMFGGMLIDPYYNSSYGYGEKVDFDLLEYGVLFGAGFSAKRKWGLLFLEFETRPGFNDLTGNADSFDMHLITTEFVRVGLLFDLKKNKS